MLLNPFTSAERTGRRDATDWRDEAACLGESRESFFPVGDVGPAIWQVNRAKEICAECPVREQCLEFALRTGQDHGVWGGLTAGERRAIRRRVRA